MQFNEILTWFAEPRFFADHTQLHSLAEVISATEGPLVPIAAIVAAIAGILSVKRAGKAVEVSKESRDHAEEASKQSTQTNEDAPLGGSAVGRDILDLATRNEEHISNLSHALADHGRTLDDHGRKLDLHITSESTELKEIRTMIVEHMDWETNKYEQIAVSGQTLRAPLEGEDKGE